jgi:purine-binding chemotaxis protein CheW
MPEYVDGVINLRGRMVPIVNLRRRFGMPRKQWDENTRIIVVEFAKKQIGFIVEALQDIVHVPPKAMEVLPSFPGDVKADYITAVGKLKERRLNLLDLKKVLRQEAALLDRMT